MRTWMIASTSASCSPVATSPAATRSRARWSTSSTSSATASTGEAVVVDPAYDIAGLLDVLAADDMRLVGALGHPLPPGPRRRRPWPASRSRGSESCSSWRRCRCTCRPTRRTWVTRVTDAGADDLITHEQRRRGDGGPDPDRAHPHARATRRAASASWSTTVSSPATPSSSRDAGAPTCPAATRRRSTRA